MTDAPATTWQQPPPDGSLERVAVDLITRAVQEVFAALDPLALARSLDPPLDPSDQAEVAGLIDAAVVELEVDFSAHRTSSLR
jgi:hypothetical protein